MVSLSPTASYPFQRCFELECVSLPRCERGVHSRWLRWRYAFDQQTMQIGHRRRKLCGLKNCTARFCLLRRGVDPAAPAEEPGGGRVKIYHHRVHRICGTSAALRRVLCRVVALGRRHLCDRCEAASLTPACLLDHAQGIVENLEVKLLALSAPSGGDAEWPSLRGPSQRPPRRDGAQGRPGGALSLSRLGLSGAGADAMVPVFRPRPHMELRRPRESSKAWVRPHEVWPAKLLADRPEDVAHSGRSQGIDGRRRRAPPQEVTSNCARSNPKARWTDRREGRSLGEGAWRAYTRGRSRGSEGPRGFRRPEVFFRRMVSEVELQSVVERTAARIAVEL